VGGRLKDKVALITGTGGGQGRAAALQFTAEGALVVGCDIKAETNQETVRLVTAAGGQMTGMAPVDLGDPDQAKAWVEAAAGVHGRIDILYNNAATVRNGSIETLSIDDWRYGIRNEIDIVFYVTKFAWPYLKRKGGVVLTTASASSHVGLADRFPTCSNNGAKLAMMRALASDGAPHGIRSVSISPGPIVSPGTASYFADPAIRERSTSGTLMKRLGTPEEIAGAAVFLVSDEASYITGADLAIDGGFVGGR